MARRSSGLIVSGVVVVLFGLAASAPAQAAGGQDFSVHVRECQQTMGFSGTHNPGVHHGFSSWDPSHTC